jgi:hypothetical protein
MEMSKPNWSDAPIWAMWLACDEDGEWYWFEFEPIPIDGGVWSVNPDGSNSLFATIADDEFVENWRETLEKRP